MCRRSHLSLLSRSTFLLLALSSLVSCGDGAQSVGQGSSIKAPEKIVLQQKSAAPTGKTGVVKSIQNAAGYSYIEVDINGQIFWMATSVSAFKPGDEIAWNGYAMMKNFTSKALQRTFPQIMFVDKVLPASAMVATQHAGRVVKTMDSAGYTYIQVDVDKKGHMVWLAAPQAKLAVGQDIRWSAGTAMRNFTSRSLDRTFDEIFFVSGVQPTNI